LTTLRVSGSIERPGSGLVEGDLDPQERSVGGKPRKKRHLSRLLEMILLIQSRPDWRPKALAEHFGVSQTRIYQDIKELVSAGGSVCFSGSGHKIAGGFELSSTTLTPEEVLELLYPEHLFAADAPGADLLEPEDLWGRMKRNVAKMARIYVRGPGRQALSRVAEELESYPSGRA
jgi:hypothetical protein